MTLKTVSLNDKYDLGKNSGVSVRHPGAGPPDADAEGSATARPGSTPRAMSPAIAARRSAASTSSSCARRRSSSRNDIVFQPGLNEDLAATALWGTPAGRDARRRPYDGVFGMWYGKGPGVDRCGDVFRHANAAGTSSTAACWCSWATITARSHRRVPHQSEFALLDAMMPILNPAGVQEILDYGLYGFALSRYSGCWVGIKCVHDTVEFDGDHRGRLDRVTAAVPPISRCRQAGSTSGRDDDRLEQERRLHTTSASPRWPSPAPISSTASSSRGGPHPKIGIIGTGKSYLDLRQALDELGIDEVEASRIGLRLLKIGMVWPLDPRIVAEFAAGLDLMIVVEEKRSLLETQLREQLCNNPTAGGHRQEGRGRQSSVPGLRHARAEPDRARHRRARAGRDAQSAPREKHG